MRSSAFLRNAGIAIRHCRSSVYHLHSPARPKPKTPNTRFSQRRQPDKTQFPEQRIYTRDVVSNIYKFLKYSTWESAQEQLRNLRIRWDSHIINQVLKTHPPMQKAWLFFNWASDLKGFKHDHFTYTTMLDIFGEAGRIQSMFFVFEQMKEKGIRIDTVTYTSLIHWVSNSGDVDHAIRLWKEMCDNGCGPTVVSYTAYMKILFSHGKVKEATNVYKEMLRSGISPNCHTYTVLMEYLVGTGKCEEALDIFFKMQETGVEPDKAACNILIGRACKSGQTSVIDQILLYMKENGLVLRYPVFLEALNALKAAGENDDLLREVNPHISAESVSSDAMDESVDVEAEDTVSLENGIIGFVLLKKQNLVAVDVLLNDMKDKNIKLEPLIVSAIVESNCNNGRTEGALLAFDYSVKTGIRLEKTAYLVLIGNLMRRDGHTKVVEAVQEIVKAGYSLGLYNAAMLIHRLGFCRRPRLASRVFELIPEDEKGVVTYTALIGVYISAGSTKKGLKIYGEMRQREIRPSLGTYNVLLSGLERGNDFQKEAESLRKEKKSLVFSCRFRENVTVDEKICDLLFAGYM
ncbi:PREDICTED: pentatricopeptide repeat-containing protein At2g01390 [Tarenaya hassleriana]|uniref:pentatricopeptide repeat-containing protein At2g01390 n=1 Tax=Tarenaya hassleriana TaxID=28532 RepID=UPI00053C0F0F|nr:PREDICTED: pentatricopeptide repeat-containing protein At2g01390 [Tarenaya hassleriana]